MVQEKEKKKEMMQIQKLRNLKPKCFSKLSTILHYCKTTHFLGVGVFMTVGFLLTTYTQLLETASESLEGIQYLIVLKSTSIKRGDIVSIQGHKSEYTGELPFTKRVIGFPGDQVIQSKTQLSLKAQNDAFAITLPLLEKTKEGKILRPLSLSTIPEGTFFVIGDHPRSFDSRYEEFGLVKMEKVWGKAVLTW